ncbi:MAG: MMPL family transporter [Candidatus Woesearchaeota archaeon]
MTKRAERRRLRLKKKQGISQGNTSDSSTHAATISEPLLKNPYVRWYDSHYKYLIFIPLICFIIAVVSIGMHMANNDGEFLKKDITLKGGVAVTVVSDSSVNTDELRDLLGEQGYLVSVRNLLSAGRPIGFLVEADIDMNDDDAVGNLLDSIREYRHFGPGDFSIEGSGASIGDSFFRQTLIALLFSFIIMASIVFITFRSFVPSVTVIIASISDIIITLSIVNMLDIHLSTAGLAAFLMLIGYSVDTNILLTNRLFKRTSGTTLERLGGAFRTGIIMSVTTLVALSVALFFTSSEVIRQVMTILFIGILVDIMNTWIQNAGFLRWYLDNQTAKKGENQ